MNNPTLGEFCFTMIGRADIEGSKSNVAMNAWLPQASSLLPTPCHNKMTRLQCHFLHQVISASSCKASGAKNGVPGNSPLGFGYISPSFQTRFPTALFSLDERVSVGDFFSCTKDEKKFQQAGKSVWTRAAMLLGTVSSGNGTYLSQTPLHPVFSRFFLFLPRFFLKKIKKKNKRQKR